MGDRKHTAEEEQTFLPTHTDPMVVDEDWSAEELRRVAELWYAQFEEYTKQWRRKDG